MIPIRLSTTDGEVWVNPDWIVSIRSGKAGAIVDVALGGTFVTYSSKNSTQDVYEEIRRIHWYAQPTQEVIE